jgi:thiopeptide-type bacteriocin biosynthesis protein
LQAHLYGHTDAILTDLASRPTDHLPSGWWFLRYRDPAPHVRLRIPITDGDHFAKVADDLATWMHDLEASGAAHDYSLHPYRPETRHGTGPARSAAEAVFAADSRAVLHRFATLTNRQASTAAGLIALAAAFTGDGPAWLVTRTPHRTGPRLDPAQLATASSPVDDKQLADTVTAYRAAIDNEHLDADEVLADLLHLHHARMIGVDTTSEQHCLRLARAVALSRTRTSR